jgi:hypothetical protein
MAAQRKRTVRLYWINGMGAGFEWALFRLLSELSW